ncbi:MAG TPA: hypothetical protein VGR95_09795 [Thermoanaerobaculia bacterium]|nr:hypothetical protein [Thermoanaerobaculia bacterium]
MAARDWSAVAADLEALPNDVISFVGVTDPFGDYSKPMLDRTFPDLVARYKEHHIVESARWNGGSRHHRYYARRASKFVHVYLAGRPSDYSEAWLSLAQTLAKRHSIRGIGGFSENAYRKQLAIPGAHLFLAETGAEIVAGQIWIVSESGAYSHATASSERGYAVRASYALYAAAIDHLSRTVPFLDLGASPDQGHGSGLEAFKAGWATTTRPVFLCGRILNEPAYSALSARVPPDVRYFPRYRAAEER